MDEIFLKEQKLPSRVVKELADARASHDDADDSEVIIEGSVFINNANSSTEDAMLETESGSTKPFEFDI
jgi:hypothetical protein